MRSVQPCEVLHAARALSTLGCVGEVLRLWETLFDIGMSEVYTVYWWLGGASTPAWPALTLLLACATARTSSALQTHELRPTHDDALWMAPRFPSGYHHYLQQPQTMVRWEGDSVRFSCYSPRLRPVPGRRIVWSRNHRKMNSTHLPAKIYVQEFSMTIKNLSVVDTSIYKCDIETLRGTYYIEFRLTVFAKSMGTAHFPPQEMVQVPSTLRMQESLASVSLPCSVNRLLPSVIQWVKVMDPGTLPQHTTYEPNVYLFKYADHLETENQWDIHATAWNFPGGRRVYNASSTFVSQELVLRPVHRRIGGLYACVVTHPVHVFVAVINLTVVPDESGNIWKGTVYDGYSWQAPARRNFQQSWKDQLGVVASSDQSISPPSSQVEDPGSSAIMATSFYSVLSMLGFLMVAMLGCLTHGVLRAKRSERVYSGQTCRSRPKAHRSTPFQQYDHRTVVSDGPQEDDWLLGRIVGPCLQVDRRSKSDVCLYHTIDPMRCSLKPNLSDSELWKPHIQDQIQAGDLDLRQAGRNESGIQDVRMHCLEQEGSQLEETHAPVVRVPGFYIMNEDTDCRSSPDYCDDTWVIVHVEDDDTLSINQSGQCKLGIDHTKLHGHTYIPDKEGACQRIDLPDKNGTACGPDQECAKVPVYPVGQYMGLSDPPRTPDSGYSENPQYTVNPWRTVAPISTPGVSSSVYKSCMSNPKDAPVHESICACNTGAVNCRHNPDGVNTGSPCAMTRIIDRYKEPDVGTIKDEGCVMDNDLEDAEQEGPWHERKRPYEAHGLEYLEDGPVLSDGSSQNRSCTTLNNETTGHGDGSNANTVYVV